MKRRAALGLLIAALSSPAAAANPILDLINCGSSKNAGCPDDYCPKPPPVIVCGNRFTNKDDYCPKPMPAAPAPNRFCDKDDYCPKGGVIHAAIGSGPAYRCVPLQAPLP